MTDNDWKKRLGVVYSTNPDFVFSKDARKEETKTLAPSAQRLIVAMERSGHSGKTVTLVKGFAGGEEDLSNLARTLKTRCGVGGTAKDGIITMQGDLRDKLVTLLSGLGYNAKRGN